MHAALWINDIARRQAVATDVTLVMRTGIARESSALKAPLQAPDPGAEGAGLSDSDELAISFAKSTS